MQTCASPLSGQWVALRELVLTIVVSSRVSSRDAVDHLLLMSVC